MTDQEKRQSLASVAEQGDRATTLCALRDVLAREIESCDSPRDVAALSGRLADVLAQIEAIKPPQTSKRDELARKRAKRQRAAAARCADAADSGESAGSDECGT